MVPLQNNQSNFTILSSVGGQVLLVVGANVYVSDVQSAHFQLSLLNLVPANGQWEFENVLSNVYIANILSDSPLY
jgi:hypothetical protein